MISLRALKYLSTQRKKDAIALLKAGRNVGAIYLMGYAVEYMLKRKICLTLDFSLGFPDRRSDFQDYTVQRSKFNNINSGVQLTQMRQIRNHNLNDLLMFTGLEHQITNYYARDWINISSWNPEDRYKIKKYTSRNAMQFIASSNIILEQIV